MSPKFCPKCGEPTTEGFKFCKKCGNPLTAAAPQPTPVAPPPVVPQPKPAAPMMNDGERTVLLDKSDAQQSFRPSDDGSTLHLGSGYAQAGGNIPPMPPQPRPVSPQPRPVTPPSQPPKKKGNGMQTVIIVLLILILLVVLGVGGWFIFNIINGDGGNGDSDKNEDSGSSNNSTYELIKADISWEEAAKKAEEKGGYLACIQDKNEEKEIIEYLNEAGSDLKVVYIGGERKGDDFEWVNGDDFDYADWTPGEPNNTNDVENYVCLYNLDTASDWGWNDCPDDMYKNYGGQFMGYTAYLIEYDEDSNRDSDDEDKDDEDKDDEDSDRDSDDEDARRDDEDEDSDRDSDDEEEDDR